MKDKYIDLIEQTFEFPQEEFQLKNNNLLFRDIDLMSLVKDYGTPLRFSYLPVIGQQIEKCRSWFANAFKELSYKGEYNYCYCTKSSHFSYVLNECVKYNAHIETSSAFDIDIIISMHQKGLLSDRIYVLCNGYKTKEYIANIGKLISLGFHRIIPIIDSFDEFELLDEMIDTKLQIGIRIASEEDPKFEFYTSRLGIGYQDVVPFYENRLKNHDRFELTMLHFFVNTGIKDNAYYWNELRKFVNVFTGLIQVNALIKHLDIGGGFPVKNSLQFDYDYQYMITEITSQIKAGAESVNAPHPNIFTEFGSFTVAESGGMIYSVLNQKRQNDRERWNMIDSSFMTTLPDTWAISKRFMMLPVNRWNEKYERVFLGGLTCDSDDYYNSEQHINAIYLPEYNEDETLYVGFFNTGAYQEAIGGYGGLQHCLIPSPKHIIINKNEKGEIIHYVSRKQQTSKEMLDVLGY